MQKKEKEELLKQRVRKVKELEIHLEVSKNKLEEANKKIEGQLAKIEELAHAQLPLKETISNQKQEAETMQLAMRKVDHMRENAEKDCKEALQA